MRAMLRWLLLTLVRLYFPQRILRGREHLPATGPAIFVLNHPNALLDPVVLWVTLGHPVRFLAKSTLFGNPIGRLTMETFGAIPVYRQQDAGRSGGGPAQNQATFTLCEEVLSRGERLALFPEGTSHTEPQLQPLKPGAAKIALGAESRHAGRLGLVVVPVGLSYAQPSVFRSQVLVHVGAPIRPADFLQQHQVDERGAVAALTAAIREALDEVVLQAQTRELLTGVARVAVWTADRPEIRDDPREQHRRAGELLEAYRVLSQRDPERVEAIVRSARDYAADLSALGVSDPWALEVGRVRPLVAARLCLELLLLLPLMAIGFVLSFAPYRLAGWVARRFTSEDDLLGTVKLLAGLMFLVLSWGLEAIGLGVAVGLRAGRPAGALAGVLLLLLAPVTGYAALRFSEKQRTALLALRHSWIRRRDPAKVALLAERRSALATAVSTAMKEAAG